MRVDSGLLFCLGTLRNSGFVALVVVFFELKQFGNEYAGLSRVPIKGLWVIIKYD